MALDVVECCQSVHKEVVIGASMTNPACTGNNGSLKLDTKRGPIDKADSKSTGRVVVGNGGSGIHRRNYSNYLVVGSCWILKIIGRMERQ